MKKAFDENFDLPLNNAEPEIETLGGKTIMAPPLSDSHGNEITDEELKKMLGSDSEPTIGVLQNMVTIGIGGIGTVFSAHDPVLHREIAIKILRPAYRNQLNYVTGFIREARITAQIDHPNVIPVHQLGVFDDAGAYFTMKRVEGVTLANILHKLKENDPETIKTYTRQRLLEIFVSICNGVAFAHSKGIIHRDLKPANIMVGDYGEVFIADWGLAIYRKENDNSNSARKIELGALPEDPGADENEESLNKISGTPAFMAPEQVTGTTADVDEQTDVYALGTILYSILTWEQSPYDGASTVTQLMRDVVYRKFLRPRRRAPRRRIPFELEAITLKAMDHDKSRRYKTVIALLSDVRNHLAKYPVSAYSPLPLYRFFKLIRRRPLVPVTLLAALLTLAAWNATLALQNHLEAQTVMSNVLNSLDSCESSRNMATSARNKLNDIFTQTGKTETYGNADALRRRFLQAGNEFTISCNNAWEDLLYLAQLNIDKAKLIPLFTRLMTNQVQFALAVNHESLLDQAAERFHQLPENLSEKIMEYSPDLRRKVEMIEKNEGELSVSITPADVQLSAVKLQNNDPEKPSESAEPMPLILKTAPEVNTLQAGLYLITAQRGNRKIMQFPVAVERDQQEILKLDIPARFPDNMIYIPGGSFIFGERTFDDQQARTQLPGFFIARNEVTIAEYLEFWKSIEDKNLRERYRARVNAPTGRQLVPLWDDQGNLLAPYLPLMPVIGVTSEAAEAYCSYMSGKSSLNYRLPTALEWEKAARGVDGRDYVWGSEYFDNHACVSSDSSAVVRSVPVTAASYPLDKSVYGVYDMTGNARELVTNPGSRQYYTAKGGSFKLSQRFARAAAHSYNFDLSDTGFRCVVDLPR